MRDNIVTELCLYSYYPNIIRDRVYFINTGLDIRNNTYIRMLHDALEESVADILKIEWDVFYNMIPRSYHGGTDFRKWVFEDLSLTAFNDKLVVSDLYASEQTGAECIGYRRFYFFDQEDSLLFKLKYL